MSYDSFPGILGRLIGANFNVTTDQAINIKGHSGASKYIIESIIALNGSLSMTTAVGGFYTGASKTGSIIVANTQVYSAMTSALKRTNCTMALPNDAFVSALIYFSLTTAQGAAATGDIYVLGRRLER